jgi:hypothetical protein
MKAAGKISILLNVVLLGGLIFLLAGRRPTVAAPASPVRPVAQTVPAASVAPVTEAPPPGEPVPFHWSQLDSKDYHIYVKNLRKIGCPEPSVRAIVTADVHSVYQIFANQMEKKLADLENGSWTNTLAADGSEQVLKDELQQLPDREAAKIADLLGETVAPVAEARAAAVTPMVLPLTLQPLDLKATNLNLNSDQIQAINNLRQSFIDKIGGPNQDTNDPAYQERWQQLQAENDEIMVGIVGEGTFEDLQLQALANSQAAGAKSAGNQ